MVALGLFGLSATFYSKKLDKVKFLWYNIIIVNNNFNLYVGGNMEKKVIYLAGDMFTYGGQVVMNYIQKVLQEELEKLGLDEFYEIYNPAANTEINDKSKFNSNTAILRGDYAMLKNTDVLIACMDNDDMGMALEIGIAWERGVPIVQLLTDMRLQGGDSQEKRDAIKEDVYQNNFLYKNQMVTGTSYENKFEEEHDEPLVYSTVPELVSGVVKLLCKSAEDNEETDIEAGVYDFSDVLSILQHHVVSNYELETDRLLKEYTSEDGRIEFKDARVLRDIKYAYDQRVEDFRRNNNALAQVQILYDEFTAYMNDEKQANSHEHNSSVAAEEEESERLMRIVQNYED